MEILEGIFSKLIVLYVLLSLVGFLGFSFWVLMLVDCAKNVSLGRNEKPLWVIVILIGNVLGAFIYYLSHWEKKSESNKLSIAYNFLLISIVAMGLVVALMFKMYPEEILSTFWSKSKQVSKSKSSNHVPGTYKRTTQPAKIHINKPETQKFISLNKRDPNADIRSNQEKTEIKQNNYTEEITSWVDEEGKMHFSNAK